MLKQLQQTITGRTVKAVFSNSNTAVTKIVLRPVIIDSELKWHAENFVSDKVYHENIEYNELTEFLTTNVVEKFKQANVFFEDENVQIKVSKKGKVFVNRAKNEKPLKVDYSHDQSKNYIIKEGEDVPALRELGIFTRENKIVNSMNNKYKQINKFVEIIDDEFKGLDLDEINIVDFGCGKSYLTFIVYYYFKHIRNIDKVTITGYDLKADVVEHCNAIAEKYNYEGLSFFVGDIAEVGKKKDIDMMVTLHACDTATDYALDAAIKNDIKYVFSVPCCQHEINNAINADDELEIILKHGLIKERFSALLTDSVRCEILKDQGYDVDVLEFVDLSHTPKNIMIRAKKVQKPKGDKVSVEALLKRFNAEQTLFRLTY